jgi:hypothetical protein
MLFGRNPNICLRGGRGLEKLKGRSMRRRTYKSINKRYASRIEKALGYYSFNPKFKCCQEWTQPMMIFDFPGRLQDISGIKARIHLVCEKCFFSGTPTIGINSYSHRNLQINLLQFLGHIRSIQLIAQLSVISPSPDPRNDCQLYRSMFIPRNSLCFLHQ